MYVRGSANVGAAAKPAGSFPDRAEEAARLLSGLPAVASVVPAADALQVTLAIGAADAGDVATALVRGGFTLIGLEPIETSLASAFRDIVARCRCCSAAPICRYWRGCT